MSMPVLGSTEPDGIRRSSRDQNRRALLGVLGMAGAAAAGSLLVLFIEPPKAIFLILLAMVVWAIGGWLLGGWRLVLTGMAALAAALAASNNSYVLLIALSGFLFIFLSQGALDQRG